MLPPHFPVLLRAWGNSCCPVARKHTPLHGKAAPSITALVWSLPYVLGTIPCIIIKGNGSVQPYKRGRKGWVPRAGPC